nr:acyl-CoA dehydrogenase family protein [Pseudomonadales bacterium]
MEVLGQRGEIVGSDYELTDLSLMYLFSRADTIYAGTNQIQRNVISERALQMPKEPRG